MTYADIENEVTLITGPVSVDVTELIRKVENDYIEQTNCTEKVTEYAVITASLSATFSLTTILTSSYPFVKEHRVEWDGCPLEDIHKRSNFQLYDSDDDAVTGTPAVYMIEGDTLRLIPEPSSAGTIRMWFTYRNAATDGTSPIIPTVDQKNLPDGVLGKVLKVPEYRDLNLAMYYDGLFAVNAESSRLKYVGRRSKQTRVSDVTGSPGNNDLMSLNSEGADGWAPS